MDANDESKFCVVPLPEEILGHTGASIIINGKGCVVKKVHKQTNCNREYAILKEVYECITHHSDSVYLRMHILRPIASNCPELYFAMSRHNITLFTLISYLRYSVDMRHNLLCNIHSIMHHILITCNITHGDLKMENVLCDVNMYGCVISIIGDWEFAVKHDNVDFYPNTPANINHKEYNHNCLNPYIQTTGFLYSPLIIVNGFDIQYIRTHNLLFKFDHICDMFGISSHIINGFNRIEKRIEPTDSVPIISKIMIEKYPKDGTIEKQYASVKDQVNMLCWDIDEQHQLVHVHTAHSRPYFEKREKNMLSVLYSHMNNIFTIDGKTDYMQSLSNEHFTHCINQCFDDLQQMCTGKVMTMLDRQSYFLLYPHIQPIETEYIPSDKIIFNGDNLIHSEATYGKLHAQPPPPLPVPPPPQPPLHPPPPQLSRYEQPPPPPYPHKAPQLSRYEQPPPPPPPHQQPQQHL